MLVSTRGRTRNRRIVGTVVALGFVFGPSMAASVGVKPVAVDNRQLAPAPSLGKGFDALDAVGPWATDRLAGRGNAVRTKAWLDFHILQETPASSKVVRGKDDYLFLRDDFTRACGANAGFQRALSAFLRLAEIIEASGRRAVFLVGPDKSSVVPQNLPGIVPTGECAVDGIAKESQVLDHFQHPLFVPVRAQLAAAQKSGHQVYPRTDTHWTSAGSAVVAQALAQHLKPSLAARIRTSPEQVTKTGDLSALLGLTSTETPRSLRVSTQATVIPDKTLDQYDPLRIHYGIERWVAMPAHGLVPGKTLILGDSFAYTALGNLRPLFADGNFLWTGHVSQDTILRQLQAADTIVIEVVQRSITGGHLFASRAFQDKVAATLGTSRR